MKKNGKIILFYGAEWCSDCRRSKKFLDDRNIPYHYIDLKVEHEAAEIVRKLNNGHQTIPTIVFPDGTILVEPTNEELEKKLRS